MGDLQLGLEGWIAAGAAVLAALSLAFNWALLSRQATLQHEAARRSLETEALSWSFAALAALAEAASLARARNLTLPPADLRSARDALALRLTILLDQSRVLFPDWGAAEARRRPLLREVLALAHKELVRMDHQAGGPAEDAAAFLDRCRLALLAEQQRSSDPLRGKFWRQRLTFVEEGRLAPDALQGLQREALERGGRTYVAPVLQG